MTTGSNLDHIPHTTASDSEFWTALRASMVRATYAAVHVSTLAAWLRIPGAVVSIPLGGKR